VRATRERKLEAYRSTGVQLPWTVDLVQELVFFRGTAGSKCRKREEKEVADAIQKKKRVVAVRLIVSVRLLTEE
jgi:hypothetical protein